mmetsp:Transcript_13759/g.24880  ORF Transcript_13759/g.24880 Transcript_13759/m.24880 type:complete len:315 (+) Transcript_13759:131-1075(+)
MAESFTMNLSHGTSLSAKVSLRTLGKLRVQHGSISSKSNTSKDEEGKGKLLSTTGSGASSKGGASSRDNNLSSLVVMPGLEGGDEVAHQLLVTDLVVVVVVTDNALLESVAGLALASGLVELFAQLVDLGCLVIVVVLFLVLLKAGSNAFSLSKGLLEEMVGELNVVPIIVLHVVLNVLRGIIDGAIFVREHANLDAASVGSAHGSDIVRVAIVIAVIELLALRVLGSIRVAIRLHVLNVLALGVTAAGVHVLALPGVLVLLGGIVVGGGSLSGGLVTLVTGIAVLLLDLLLVAEGGLEVGVHVDNVFAVVVGA